MPFAWCHWAACGSRLVSTELGTSEIALLTALDSVNTGSPPDGQSLCFTYPISSENRSPVRGPSKCIGVPKPLDLVDAGFRFHIPDLDNTVIADTGKFNLLDGVECYL